MCIPNTYIGQTQIVSLMTFFCSQKMTVFYFYMHAFMALLVLQSNLPYFHVSLGWFITYSVVPKVQKFMVSGHFPIPLDPKTSPSEKFSKNFDI